MAYGTDIMKWNMRRYLTVILCNDTCSDSENTFKSMHFSNEKMKKMFFNTCGPILYFITFAAECAPVIPIILLLAMKSNCEKLNRYNGRATARILVREVFDAHWTEP